MCPCPEESQPNGAKHHLTKDWAKHHLSRDGPGGIERLVPSCHQYDDSVQPSECGTYGLKFSN